MDGLPPSSGLRRFGIEPYKSGKPVVAPRVSGPTTENGRKPHVAPHVSGPVAANGGKPVVAPRVSGLPPPGELFFVDTIPILPSSWCF
jgi:hypothetical protein